MRNYVHVHLTHLLTGEVLCGRLGRPPPREAGQAVYFNGCEHRTLNYKAPKGLEKYHLKYVLYENKE